MPTGQAIINSALTTLGVLELGGTPSAAESNDCLDALNTMWDAWSIDEGLIYAVRTVNSLALSAATASYTIGSGATWNTARPTRIYKAIVYSGTAPGTNRNELELVDATRYFKHNDLSASALTPEELYCDFQPNASGYATCYLWPVPSGTTLSVELDMGVAFSSFTLAGNYQLPYGYNDAIVQALAWRLLPRFALVVPDQFAQNIASVGAKAEQRIRAMNATNRQQPIDMMQIPVGNPQAQAQK